MKKVSEKMRKRIFEIIQIGNREDLPSRSFDIFIVAAIVLNIAVLILDTFDELSAYDDIFLAVEIATVLIFCVEYALRIWTADYLFPGESRGRAVLKFLRSFDGVVDLLTILPFFFLSGMGAIRFLRVARIFHLFRINTQYESFQVITSVLKEKRNQILSSVFIIMVLMLASSLFMYSAEHEAQPEVFANAFSGIWWSMSTLLTVGYGDIYPVTPIGQAMAIVIAVLGVGAVAIPTGIISAGFVENYTEMAASAARGDIELQTVVIDLDSAWIGKSAREIEEIWGLEILIVKRGKKSWRPDESFRVSLRDALIVFPK